MLLDVSLHRFPDACEENGWVQPSQTAGVHPYARALHGWRKYLWKRRVLAPSAERFCIFPIIMGLCRGVTEQLNWSPSCLSMKEGRISLQSACWLSRCFLEISHFVPGVAEVWLQARHVMSREKHPEILLTAENPHLSVAKKVTIAALIEERRK